MWRNYLTVGYRALTGSRAFASINIFGLAIGLAACLLLLLYVRYETSYDAWLPEAERVYQVQTSSIDRQTGVRTQSQGVTQPVAAALAKDFPEIEAISKLESEDIVVMKDGFAVPAQASYAADERFFDIVQLRFLHGEGRTALRDPDSVVFSRSEAVRLFGSADVLGRTVETVRNGEPRTLRITGVFEDLPRNSHMNFASVRRFNAAEEEACGWGCVSGMTYAKLRPGADAGRINAAMPAWEKRNVPERDIAGGEIRKDSDWRLVPVRDVHLGAAGDGDRPGNDMRTIVTFATVAALILGMAVVNFVNLATARAGRRAREVAVRKVLGARRGQLVAQFLGESLAFVALSMLIAMALVELMLPTFSAWLDADLAITWIGNGGIALPVLGLTLLVGLLGGLYPAFYLSRYKPAAILRGGRASETAGSGRLRNMLVLGQFGISIGLMICTAIIYQQTVFARTADAGFKREGLFQIDGFRKPEVAAVRETLAREIEVIEGVTAVSAAMIVPGSDRTYYTMVQAPGAPAPLKIGRYSVEPDFWDTLGVKIVAGRALSPSQARDKAFMDTQAATPVDDQVGAIAQRGVNVVLNREAAARLGFADPAAAIGKELLVPIFGEDNPVVPATIVGVSENSRFRSVREAVEPILYYNSGQYIWLAVRYEASDPYRVRDQIQKVWRRLLPTVPFDGEFAEDRLNKLYGADVARGTTFGGFALLAILIACLGLFGLAAFTAERRTKEIGIRKVFGARIRDIVRLLAWQFSKPVVAANLLAWPVAWWVMRDWLNQFDARIALTPGPFVLAGALALAIALGTIAGHAIKAARLNPIHALRYE